MSKLLLLWTRVSSHSRRQGDGTGYIGFSYAGEHAAEAVAGLDDVDAVTRIAGGCG